MRLARNGVLVCCFGCLRCTVSAVFLDARSAGRSLFPSLTILCRSLSNDSLVSRPVVCSNGHAKFITISEQASVFGDGSIYGVAEGYYV